MLEEPRSAWINGMLAAPPVPAPAAAAAPLAAALVLASLARHRWLITLCGLLGLMAAFAFTKLAKPRFEASAELLIDPRDLVLLDKEVTPRSPAGDSGIAVVESQSRVLQSDVVLQRAIAKLKLDQDPEFNGSRKGVIATARAALAHRLNIATPAATPGDPALAALQTVQQRVYVRRPERTYVVDLTVWTESSEKSVALADAIIKSYFEEQAAARSDPARKAGEAIDSGLDSLRQKLAVSESKVARYKSDKNLVGVSGKLVTEQQLAEINNQLLAARSELGRAKSRLDDSKRLRNNPDANPEAVNSAALRQLRGQLSVVLGQKAKLSTQLKPQHPAMIAILEQERGLQVEIRDELRRVTATTAIEYERAKSVEATLSADLETLRTQMNTANEAQIKLRELEAELEANRAVYQTATVRARETREQARLNTTNVRILAEPTPARDRTFPPSAMVLLPMGLLAGLGTGAFFGLLRDLALPTQIPSLVLAATPARAKPRVTSAAQLPVAARTPSASSVPPAPPPPVPTQTAAINALRSRSIDSDGPPFTFTNLRGTLPQKVTSGGKLGATPHEQAHQIFRLASSVILTPQNGIGRKLNRLSEHLASIRPLRAGARQPHIIIMTSDEPNPMKSVVALGLATAMQARNRKVLLVDADIDSGCLSSALADGSRHDVQDVLSGQVPLAAAVRRQDNSFDRLTLTRRAATPRRNAINQESLRRIVRQAHNYDAIVIETPPLNSPSVDATFSQAACQVLLAMRVPPATEDVILGAMHTLRKAVPKFCGLVITD